MERKNWYLQLCLILFSSLLSPAVSLNPTVPSHGCYWNVTCQERWWGDCAMGHRISGQSNDCQGLCPEPQFPFCPTPCYTRFYCCIHERPRVTKDLCTRCDAKVDSGEEYYCCSDCSYPKLVSDDPKLGYCISGAEILVEPKPKEMFKWIIGSWKSCSAPCGGGIRSRNVECYAVITDSLSPDYPVYDDKCSAEEMPAREEPCNLTSCSELNRRKNIILSCLGVVTIIGVGFAVSILYRRKMSIPYGQVYILMEGNL